MRPPNSGVGGASTINDVARLAGVSIKTVSRVMNNEPNVRPETRDKVQEAANLLHYRPNLLARSLAGSRSFLIALFYDNPNPAYITELQRGVINRARGSGYHLLVEPQDSHAPDLARQITNLLATIRLDGIILSPPLCDMAVVLQAIEAAGVPYVRVSPFLNPDRSPCVRMDDAQAAYELTRKLIDMGHKDIGFVLGHPEHGGAHQRYEGFVRALREEGGEPRPEWIRQGYFSYESGVEAGRAILTPGTKHPTAIFASNDYMALGVMAYAQQSGMRLPDDLSVAGFDDAPGALRTWPPLTTVRQPVEDMAFAAADLLLTRDEVEGGTAVVRTLPYTLIVRDSVRGL